MIFSPFFFTVLTLWLGHFIVDFMLGIWPVYKTIASLDIALAGMIAAFSSLVGEGSQLLFGALSDRGYRKYLIALGVLLTSLSTFLVYTQNYFILLFLFTGVSLGSGMFHPTAASLLVQITDKRKALLLGTYIAGGGLGMAVSQLVFMKIYQISDGNVLFLAAPTLLIALLVFTKAFSSPPSPKKHELSLFAHIKSCFLLFKIKELRTLYVVQLTNQTVFWSFVFLLPDILYSRGYEDWIAFGGGHMFLISGASLAMIPGGYFADHFSSRKILLFSSSMGLFLTSLFIYLPPLPNWGLLSLLFVLGGTVGIVNPVALALGSRLIPSNPGTVNAFLMGLVWCVAEVLGPGGGGLLTKLFSEDAPAKALAILCMSFPICFFASYLLPEWDAKKKDLGEKIGQI